MRTVSPNQSNVNVIREGEERQTEGQLAPLLRNMLTCRILLLNMILSGWADRRRQIVNALSFYFIIPPNDYVY